MTLIIALVIAYVLGSLSTSTLLAKYTSMPDPRQSGSGNPGATNVLRSGNKKQALMVLLGDMAKGFLAIMIALIFGQRGGALGFIAVAAVAGHIFPVFHKFQGGKGVATALGTLIILSLPSAIISVIAWVAIVFVTGYVSLASMVAVAATFLLTLLTGSASVSLFYLIIAALVIWRHKDNIERLKKGSEAKFDIKALMGKKPASKANTTPPPSQPSNDAPTSSDDTTKE